ncbi:MAG: hypothetical protein VKL41_05000, partial [Snowella sp.]|nr:hypothetical protein [Snowella sp.]
INNQKNHQSNPKYLPLAQFFERLRDDAQSQPKINYTLSAIFYCLATGFVPNSLWKRLDLPPKKVSARLTTISRKDVGIITIHRKLTQTETFTRNLSTVISGVFKPVTVPLILLPTLFLIGFISGVVVPKTTLFQQIFSTTLSTSSSKKLTIAALTQIIKDNKDYLKVNEDESQATIIELLDSTGKTYNLDFQQIDPPKWLFWHSSPKAEDLSSWTNAIRNYQQKAVAQQQQAGVNKKLRLNPTGEIKQGDPTDQYLRCQLQKDLQLISKPEKIEQCHKYGVTGLTPDPTNPPPDLRPSPSPTPSPNPSGSDEMDRMDREDWPTTTKPLCTESAEVE